jgi:hypothetical protein
MQPSTFCTSTIAGTAIRHERNSLRGGPEVMSATSIRSSADKTRIAPINRMSLFKHQKTNVRAFAIARFLLHGFTSIDYSVVDPLKKELIRLMLPT